MNEQKFEVFLFIANFLKDKVQFTKVDVAGLKNERDHLKERLEMVTSAFEKTNLRMHDQKVEFDKKLEDEKQKL